MSEEAFDQVKKAKGYNCDSSGVETKEVTWHLGTALGSALKYVWRAGLKGDELLDLQKAEFCFLDEAKRLIEEPGEWMLSWRWVPAAHRVIGTTPQNDRERLLRECLASLLSIRMNGSSAIGCVVACAEVVGARIVLLQKKRAERAIEIEP